MSIRRSPAHALVTGMIGVPLACPGTLFAGIDLSRRQGKYHHVGVILAMEREKEIVRYRHQFTVNAPLDDVVDFHRHSASMGAITPPPIVAEVNEAPDLLAEGDDMKFTLWLGPLPLRWHARIEDVTADGFTDRQISGPFQMWDHRHTFETSDASSTIVRDEIEIVLSKHPGWKILGALMVLNLPILFAYRGWRTRRLLSKNGKLSSTPKAC